MELRKHRILPVITRKGTPDIQGLGKLRYVVEQTFVLFHQFKRLTVRWERRTELHDAVICLACSLICWRRVEHLDAEHCRPTSGAWPWAGVAGVLATFDTGLTDLHPPELAHACRRLYGGGLMHAAGPTRVFIGPAQRGAETLLRLEIWLLRATSRRVASSTSSTVSPQRGLVPTHSAA